MIEQALTPDQVRELFAYDPDTGVLTWLRRDRSWFKTDRAWRIWNTKNAGNVALATPHPRGHLQGSLAGHCVKAHRVAWCHYYGVWPSDEIDHINRDCADNRISNLRDVNRQTNELNKSKSDREFVGVYPYEHGYYAQIHRDGRTIGVGTFATRESARDARAAMLERLGK